MEYWKPMGIYNVYQIHKPILFWSVVGDYR